MFDGGIGNYDGIVVDGNCEYDEVFDGVNCDYDRII
jgi:hypothetical protein